ncbi:hypothetical protein VTL71DRAFT_4308 [Oculimacula yallundae]|uniref:Nephrocystin 3-like N-terminal domain-containing protein n=1 Tax=Oculimacula yallundae TaxID=86028 RepID=A0ABR4C5E6_9HELO
MATLTVPTASFHRAIKPTGITVVADPEGALLDIALLHGLQGHPEKTWTATASSARENVIKSSNRLGFGPRKSSSPLFASTDTIPESSGSAIPVFWPRDLLAADERFDQARILTCGYDSHIVNFFQANNQDNLLGHAQTLLVQLQQIRKTNPNRPLIFVVHSLGGILLKEILDRARRSTHQPQFLTIYTSTKGIIFLGTPHRGSDAAGWGLMATTFAKLALQGANKKILETLKPDNSLLEHLRKVFLEMLEDRKFNIHSFYEQVALTGAPGLQNQVVVSKDSAAVGHARAETVAGIDKNHLEMCRFSGFGDNNYVAISGAIEDYIIAAGVQTSQKKLLRPDVKTIHVSDEALEEEAECIKSLWYPDMDARALDPALTAEPGTCEWILSHQKILLWTTNQESALLFLSGKPGCGKSVLTKYLKDMLPTLPTSRVQLTSESAQIPIVAYFPFNDRGDQKAKKFYSMIRSILYQVFKASPVHFRFSELLESYKLLKTGGPHTGTFEWPLHLLREAWRSILRCDTGVPLYVLVDALDEAETSTARETLALLRPIRPSETKEGCLKVKAFVTGRPEVIIRLCDESYREIPRIRLEDEDEMANTDDIAIYVKNQIVRVPTHRRIELGPLFSQIVKQANGILLWAKLVVEHVVLQAATDSYQEIHRSITEIPSDMKDVYRTMLEREKDNRHAEERRRIFQWVLFATGPITLPNLQVAILMRTNPCSHPGCFSCISEAHNEVGEAEMENRLITRSSGLLELRKAPYSYVPPTVQLIHQSAKDFLLENPKEWFPEMQANLTLSECSHTFLAACCFWYLNHMDLPSTMLASHIYETDPFGRYAVASWPYHVIHSGSQSSLLWAAFSDLIRNREAFDFVCRAGELHHIHSKHQYPTSPITPLIISTYHTLPAFVINLLETSDHMINKRDGSGRTAISMAAEIGNETIFRALLGFKGVDIGLVDKRTMSPFDWAVMAGRASFVQLIMQAKSEVISKHPNFLYSPLCISAQYGHIDLVRQFLSVRNFMWTTAIQCGESRDPLLLAADSGHLEIAKILNSKSHSDLLNPERMGRALRAAWKQNHLLRRWGVIEYLCSFRIDDKQLLSEIFSHATSHGRINTLKVILANQSITVNSITIKGQSPLLFAIEHNQMEVFDYILSAGAEYDYMTLVNAIRLTAFIGTQSSYARMIKALIEGGDIDLRRRDFEGRTPAELLADTIKLNPSNEQHRLLIYLLQGDSNRLFVPQKHMGRLGPRNAAAGDSLKSYKSRRNLVQPLAFYL